MLDHKISFYVPSTLGTSAPVSEAEHERRAEEIAAIFADRFGGASVEEVSGYYKANDGTLVKERIKKVLAYCEDAAQAETIAESLGRLKRIEWKQESIMMELDNAARFI